MNPVKPDRFGGALFLAAGVAFGVSAVLFFFSDVVRVPGLLRAAYSLLAVFFLAGLGCPSALPGEASSRSSFDRWVVTLAMVGLAVGLVDSARATYINTVLLPWPKELPALFRRLDPLGIVIFPSIGLWVLASSLRLRRLAPPWRKLGNLGVVCGVLLFAPPVTETLSILGWRYIAPLFGVVALLMSVIVLLWFGGVGLLLLKPPGAGR
jgi:hypothetical protein